MPIWTSKALKDEALGMGFDACRICSVEEAWAASGQLEAFLEAGHHGEMDWMEETKERRSHPQNLWLESRSAIVVAMNYGPEHDPLTSLEQTSSAAISVYAKGKDYHDVLKKRLKRLARAYVAANDCEIKVFVDTAPIMEKPLAAKAGVGWQGKHTNLVSKDFGSWLFLGVMLTEERLAIDEAETDHCGSCRACLDICPTKAFPEPYRLDARRCISYLTIEHGGPIPHEFRSAMGNRIYGCDDCLAVCPWNKFASLAGEMAFHNRETSDDPPLADLLALSEDAFRARFSGSPIKRIKRRRFLRNALIAAGNSGDANLIAPVQRLLDDEEPLIRGAAVWALQQLDRGIFADERAVRVAGEDDLEVLAEWGEP